jgi:hypothetical protein
MADEAPRYTQGMGRRWIVWALLFATLWQGPAFAYLTTATLSPTAHTLPCSGMSSNAEQPCADCCDTGGASCQVACGLGISATMPSHLLTRHSVPARYTLLGVAGRTTFHSLSSAPPTPPPIA